MPVVIEDKRQAASLAVGVSNQLITASLAMLPILGAILVFVLDKRTMTWCGGITVILSFLSFLVSIGAGAKGIAAVYKKGHLGRWHYLNGDVGFQIQVFTSFLGLILFTVSMFLMGPAQPEVEISKVRNSVDSLRIDNNLLNSQLRQLQITVDSLKLKM